MIACALLLSSLFLPHEDSVSSSAIEIGKDSIQIELRFQALSMDEVIALDADGDGRIQPGEALASSADMGSYLAKHYSISQGSDLPSDGELLRGKLLEVYLDPETLDLDIASQWLSARLEYPRNTNEAALWIDVSLFRETSPGHKDFAQLFSTDATVRTPERTWIFSRSDPQWLLRLPMLGPESTRAQNTGIGIWIQLGFRHILSGADHLCFVLGLLLAASGLRALAGTVTAFTFAHSITLGAVALGWFSVSPALTEPLIAASIAFVGFSNLWAGKPRRAWPEAFGFGLLHGLGFATLLSGALGAEEARLGPLLGFNLGIELGQLLAALAVVGVLALVRRRSAAESTEGLAPPKIARAGSQGIALAGLFMLCARVLA
jgi:hydrogenase/urease accessory protein HupE